MIQSNLEKSSGRKQTLIRLEMNVILKGVEMHIVTFLHKQKIDQSIRVSTMLNIQCSLYASAHCAGYRQTVALQGLSDKPYRPAPSPL